MHALTTLSCVPRHAFQTSVVIRPSFQFDEPLPDLSNVEDITFPFLLEDCIAWMMEKGTRLAFHILGK